MKNICLSCQISARESVLVNGYHSECSQKLFDTSEPPEILFGTADISIEVQKMAGKLSVSGAQPKLSLMHDPAKQHLKVVALGGRYILKPQTDRFPLLPENENLCINIASLYGLEVPVHGLIPLADGRLAYIVKRFDRLGHGKKRHQEDFQQLLQKKDKYNGSYEQISNFIKKHSERASSDLKKLYESALLFFVLGNGDAHLKNFSLMHNATVGCHLSPSYDIVSSRLVLPAEREEMCLSIQGKKNRITAKDFIRLAQHFGLSSQQADNIHNRLSALLPEIEKRIKESFLTTRLKTGLLEIFRERMKRI